MVVSELEDIDFSDSGLLDDKYNAAFHHARHGTFIISLLADTIYPNRYPLITPYTRAQIRQRDNKRQCRR